MPRKVARTYLSPRLASILAELVSFLGLTESEILRQGIIELAYAKGLMKDIRKRPPKL